LFGSGEMSQREGGLVERSEKTGKNAKKKAPKKKIIGARVEKLERGLQLRE